MATGRGAIVRQMSAILAKQAIMFISTVNPHRTESYIFEVILMWFILVMSHAVELLLIILYLFSVRVT